MTAVLKWVYETFFPEAANSSFQEFQKKIITYEIASSYWIYLAEKNTITLYELIHYGTTLH